MDMTESVDLTPERSICQLCLENPAKYRCPRCHINYCSLTCYRGTKHMQCSELFYRNWFMQELQSEAVDTERKNKMLKMLEKFEKEQPQEYNIDSDGKVGNSEDDTDDDEEITDNDEEITDNDEDVADNDEDGLAGRIRELDLSQDANVDKLWDKLTSKEKREFERLCNSEKLGCLIDLWTPWWEDHKSVITTDGESVAKHPEILQDNPSLKELVESKRFSPCIPYNLISVLLSYSYICRRYNGEHREHPAQAVRELLSSCPTLDAALTKPINYDNISDAIQDCLMQVPVQENGGDVDDVGHILQGPYITPSPTYILSALSDLIDLFDRSRKQVSGKERSELCRILKKLEFLLEYVRIYGDKMCELHEKVVLLATQLNHENKVRKEEIGKVSQINTKLNSKSVHFS